MAGSKAQSKSPSKRGSKRPHAEHRPRKDPECVKKANEKIYADCIKAGDACDIVKHCKAKNLSFDPKRAMDITYKKNKETHDAAKCGRTYVFEHYGKAFDGCPEAPPMGPKSPSKRAAASRKRSTAKKVAASKRPASKRAVSKRAVSNARAKSVAKRVATQPARGLFGLGKR